MLKPLKIGEVKIDFPIVLAALAGYSDLAYRLICRSCSAPYCTTEAMLDHQMILERKVRRRLVKVDEVDHPVGGQIMGNNPDRMARAAAALSDMGFDIIDLNFACPVRKVLARQRGGYIMSQPGQALDIINAVVGAVRSRPVTIKLRHAFYESDNNRDAFWKIAHGAFDAGIEGICVHARSVEQKYRGRADWDFLSQVKREFADRTIIGSGDVHTAADALRMIDQTGVDGVAAARGAIGNPWIFRQARDIAEGRNPFQPDIDEQRDLLSRHFRLACDLYGPKRGPKIMRNFGIYYARMHLHPAQVRTAFVNIKNAEDWEELMKAYYEGTGQRQCL